LGGPRFQRIFQEYDNPRDASDDEESGEDQGLVENSSLRGSSRALTGVGAVRQASGLENGEEMMTIDPSTLDTLPDYSENDEVAAPLLLGDAAMNDGELLASIEDEGVDMSMGYNTLNYNNNLMPRGGTSIGGSWNFDALNSLGANSRQMISGTGSDMDDASDIVQHDSSASVSSLDNRVHAFEDSEAVDEHGDPFIDPSPVPDLDEDGQVAAISLQADLLERMNYSATQQFEVTDDNEPFDVEEPAAEIHIEDSDELKID
jgi:ubiquitin carboxyl-terminal hydrolase 4/11/15